MTEKEEEFATELERHAATEAYVEELRSRVAKASDRETSTEAYIQDLEEKIKGFSSSSMTTSESLTSLQKELSRHKEQEATNAAYIAGLEARLSKAEESVLDLRDAVARAEDAADRRADEVKELEHKLSLMRGDEQGWRRDLETREDKVRELEAKLEAWETTKNDAAHQRERLGNLALTVADARKDMDGTSKATTPSDESPLSSLLVNGQTSLDASHLQSQLRDLQETHTATLSDLSSVSDKYRDALREISDLATQLQEAKLQQHSHSSANSVSDAGEIPATVSRRRKPSVTLTDSLPPTSARRPFFKQAASTESLRTRQVDQFICIQSC